MSQSKKSGPKLCCDSYVALALQPKVYGCRNRDDMKKNLDNQLKLIDNSIIGGLLYGGGPVKLISLPEGSIQGFYDELNDWDHPEYCKELAIEVPGKETDMLAQKAKEYGVYITAQAKIMDPDIATDRYFNMGFIISPEGEIILKHFKNIISLIEGSASPYDFWDKWVAKYGDTLEAQFPVVKTDIGNLGMSICAESLFPETFRGLNVMGAEVIVNVTLPEPMVMMEAWEFSNRSRAFDNACYLVCPNSGPYYMTPDEDAHFSLLGGNTMIVDYRGYNHCKVIHQNEACVPAQINIKALREYRENSPHAGHIGQMRSGLWKKIYERWPDFPKNRYMEKTYPSVLDRHVLLLEHVNKLFDEDIWTRSE